MLSAQASHLTCHKDRLIGRFDPLHVGRRPVAGRVGGSFGAVSGKEEEGWPAQPHQDGRPSMAHGE